MHGVNVEVSIPVGQAQSELWLPHYGYRSPVVTDTHEERVTVLSGLNATLPAGIRGVRMEENAVVVALAPGSYSLRLSTQL